jgi:hypothetical protein
VEEESQEKEKLDSEYGAAFCPLNFTFSLQKLVSIGQTEGSGRGMLDRHFDVLLIVSILQKGKGYGD